MALHLCRNEDSCLDIILIGFAVSVSIPNAMLQAGANTHRDISISIHGYRIKPSLIRIICRESPVRMRD